MGGAGLIRSLSATSDGLQVGLHAMKIGFKQFCWSLRKLQLLLEHINMHVCDKGWVHLRAQKNNLLPACTLAVKEKLILTKKAIVPWDITNTNL